MALEVDIKKTFGEFTLKTAFKTDRECHGILGESGCGKTLTLKCIAGIEKPDEGIIILNGRVLFDSEKKINLPPQNRNVGYMFQNYALFPNMTIEENVGVGILGKSKKEKKELVRSQMERFHLEGLEKRYSEQLSGGQQQRVAMARIMAYNPEIIILDEPFSALDGYLKDILQQDLLETIREYKGDVLMVSHSRNEIFKFCNNITIMEQGQVVSEGNTREIFRKPLTKGAARLTGCKNISEIRRISEYELEALDWGVRLKTAVPISDEIEYVGFRGHRFQVVEKDNLAETENVMPIHLMKYAEEPFEVQFLVRNREYLQGNDIWWIEPKKEFNSIIRNEIPGYLAFPKEELMLLQK